MTAPREACCPSCGRHIGADPSCPYCGAENRDLRGFRLLRRAALLLALLGLTFLLLASRNRELPLVAAGTIGPTMNFARVRVRGRIERRPYVRRGRHGVEYVSFLLRDATGTLRIAAYDATAHTIAAADKVPSAGDTIEAAGTLSVRAGRGPRLRLSRAEDVRPWAGPGEADG